MSVKAFELVPTLDLGKLLSNPKSQLTSIELCGKNLYIGTDDSILVHLTCEDVPSQNGRTAFRFHRESAKSFQNKKSINQLKAASALNRILMLCDNNIVLLSMLDTQVIPGAGKVKAVSAFCLNENPLKGDPYTVEICTMSRKRGLQMFSISDDKVTHLKDISLPQPPVTMSIDGSFVCVATTSEYLMVNHNTNAMQQLFPYDEFNHTPVITRISKEEYLLSAPGALGMFATTVGISQRPPLQWNNGVTRVAYTHPYILALNDEFITVHSILDQQQKQSVAFTGGRVLGEFDGKLLVARHRDLYALVPVPLEKQIQALLTDKRVKEALDLAKNATKLGCTRDQFNKMYERIEQQAGFIELIELHLDEACAHFTRGKLDPRELIVLFPGLLCAGSGFLKAVPPLHEIADMVQVTRGDAHALTQYKQFLMDYLQQVRPLPYVQHCSKEIDIALVKLYAEFSSPNLLVLITSSPHNLSIEDVQPTLQKHNEHHALASLHKAQGHTAQALEIWTDIVEGRRADSTFPGFPFVVEFLANVEDADLVWRYADWALSRDQQTAVQIFTRRSEDSEKLSPELVLDALVKYPVASQLYLEHLVFTRKSKIEKFHTHLAMLYLDNVMKLKEEGKHGQELDLVRSKLRHLLQTSDLYRTQLLLSRLQSTDMHAELAILYGKVGEHDKALRLLVHELSDFGAAENYCVINSQHRPPQHRQTLFHTLLAIYLDPSNDEERREFFVAPAMKLLNDNKYEFDPLKVLPLVPAHWSVGLLSHFLSHVVRGSMHTKRMAAVERHVSGGQRMSTRHALIQHTRLGITLAENKKCMVCKQAFTEASFVRFPNGVIAHTECAPNVHVCPVTGRRFKSRSSIEDTRTAHDTSPS